MLINGVRVGEGTSTAKAYLVAGRYVKVAADYLSLAGSG